MSGERSPTKTHPVRNDIRTFLTASFGYRERRVKLLWETTATDIMTPPKPSLFISKRGHCLDVIDG